MASTVNRSYALDAKNVSRLSIQSGHYLQYKNKPLLLLGDSVTQGWFECGNDFDQQGYIDALAQREINILMIWCYIGTNAVQQKNDDRIGYDSPEIWPWHGSPDKKTFDLTQLNPAYFNRLKAFVNYAATKNIVVLICIHDGWTKRRFACHPFNRTNGNGPLTAKHQYVELADYEQEMPARYNASWTRKQKNQYFQERFCDRLIAELKPYSNVIYELFNEGGWYDSTSRHQHEQHFLRFFHARCQNLLMSNSDGISIDDPHHDSKVDIISLHGKWENQFGVWERSFNRAPTKPYFHSEPVSGWSGEKSLLPSIRRSLWEAALGGAGWVCQNDASFGWDKKTLMSTRASERDRAYDYIGYCIRFFKSEIDLTGMKPKGNVASTGIAMAADGTKYLVYCPTGGKIIVDLSVARGLFEYRWYNPRAGGFGKTKSVNGEARRSFVSPDNNDWILYIKKLI